MEYQSFQEKYGWDRNPFNYKRNSAQHIGFEDFKSKIIRHIDRENMCHLYGNVGMGKSALLEWLTEQEHRFDNSLEIDYFETVNLSPEKLEKFYQNGFLQSLVGGSKKKVAVIDNAQNMSEDTAKKLEYAHEKGRIDAVVLASIDQSLNVTHSIEDRVGDRRYKLRNMRPNEARLMVENRLEGLENPFTEEAIEEVAELADFRPRRILEHCELLASELEPPITREDPLAKIVGEKEDREQVSGLTRSELMDKLTGRQQEIVEVLYEHAPLNSDQIVEEGAAPSKSSLRPYLHKLSSKEKLKEKRGIPLKLIEKEDSEEGTDTAKWILTDDARTLLAKN